MGAGLPADIRRAQSGQVPCSGARRRGEALDEVSAAIPGDAVAGNNEFTGSVSDPVERLVGFLQCSALVQCLPLERGSPCQRVSCTSLRIPLIP